MSRHAFISGVVVLISLTMAVTDAQAQIGGTNTNTGGGLVGGGNTGGNAAATGLVGGGANATANTGGNARQAGTSFANAFGGGGNTGGGGNVTRQFGNAGGGGRGGGTGGGGMVESARRVIRPVYRIAFTYPIARAGVENSLNGQFDRVSIRLNNRFKGLGLTTDKKGVVTLSGRVTSESDKKLAAAYARLEPGVRKIENNLVVSPSQSPSSLRGLQQPASPVIPGPPQRTPATPAMPVPVLPSQPGF
ncbi:BON domain-containing protein [bacterium]|nr:BON domain-containing protein [bacterium]